MGKLVPVWHKYIVKEYVSILNRSHRIFSFNFVSPVSGGALLNVEALNFVIIASIPCPNKHISDGRTANPPLATVDPPAAFDFSCCSLQPCCVTAIMWLRKPKANDFFEFDSRWQPSLLLLFISKRANYRHTEVCMSEIKKHE